VTGPLAQQFAQVWEARDWIWRQAENDAPPHGWRQREELIERFDAALSFIERHVQDMGLEAFEALRDVEALAENGKLAGGLDEAEALFEEIRDRALAALPARESTYRHIRRTATETFNFDPAVVREHFGDPPGGTSYEDWVLDLFYRYEGSLFGDEIFGSCADLDYGNELLPEGWGE